MRCSVTGIFIRGKHYDEIRAALDRGDHVFLARHSGKTHSATKAIERIIDSKIEEAAEIVEAADCNCGCLPGLATKIRELK